MHECLQAHGYGSIMHRRWLWPGCPDAVTWRWSTKKLLRPGLFQEYIAAELAGTFHLLSRRTGQVFITSISPEPQ